MMRTARWNSLLLGSAWLLTACSSDSPQPSRSRDDDCEREGKRCSCDDGSKGVYACDDDDELVCQCDEGAAGETDDEETDDEKTTKRDAGTDARPRDTGDTQDASASDPSDEVDEDEVGETDASVSPTPNGPAPRVPEKPATCPQIQTGTVKVLGQDVQLWVGTKQPGKKGPIMFYWHGTGGSSSEASLQLGAVHRDILAQGGVIASFTTTTRMGQNTGNNVWYTGDFAMADQILACAIEQQDVDPRRVYTGGCSAGGLQASAMVYSRSSYLAGAMPNSGGSVGRYQLEDSEHVPVVIATHGAAGRDWVIIDFASSTATLAKDLAAKGGFVVVCDHGGGHCGSTAQVTGAQWEFLQAHPFGVDPEPYSSGLPSSFPAGCEIISM